LKNDFATRRRNLVPRQQVAMKGPITTPWPADLDDFDWLRLALSRRLPFVHANRITRGGTVFCLAETDRHRHLAVTSSELFLLLFFMCNIMKYDYLTLSFFEIELFSSRFKA
jgi:hypothetical protein